MTQAQIVRSFAADPAGVALLLAGPAAEALWPSAPRDADNPPVVRLGVPLRAGVGFVVDLTVVEPELGSVRGRLALLPDTGELPITSTSARLDLTASYADTATLRARGVQFLAALGSLAVARSSAA